MDWRGLGFLCVGIWFCILGGASIGSDKFLLEGWFRLPLHPAFVRGFRSVLSVAFLILIGLAGYFWLSGEAYEAKVTLVIILFVGVGLLSSTLAVSRLFSLLEFCAERPRLLGYVLLGIGILFGFTGVSLLAGWIR